MYSEVFPFSSLHLLTDTVRGAVQACTKNNTKQKRDLGENTFAGHITVFPRRRAGMPESWVPLTLVPSEQWYHWCTPTGPGSCCWHPSHLKHTHTVSISWGTMTKVQCGEPILFSVQICGQAHGRRLHNNKAKIMLSSDACLLDWQVSLYIRQPWWPRFVPQHTNSSVRSKARLPVHKLV